MQIRDSVSILCPVDNVSDIERRHPERERGGGVRARTASKAIGQMTSF